MGHGVRYNVTYGWGPTLHVLGKSVYSWGIIAYFTGSPVVFTATGGGAPGSAGFNASMAILKSVRASREPPYDAPMGCQPQVSREVGGRRPLGRRSA